MIAHVSWYILVCFWFVSICANTLWYILRCLDTMLWWWFDIPCYVLICWYVWCGWYVWYLIGRDVTRYVMIRRQNAVLLVGFISFLDAHWYADLLQICSSKRRSPRASRLGLHEALPLVCIEDLCLQSSPADHLQPFSNTWVVLQLESECLQGQRSNSQGKMLISTGHRQRSPVSSVHHVYVGSVGSVCSPSAGSCDDPDCKYAHNRSELKEIPGLVQSQDFIEVTEFVDVHSLGGSCHCDMRCSIVLVIHCACNTCPLSRLRFWINSARQRCKSWRIQLWCKVLDMLVAQLCPYPGRAIGRCSKSSSKSRCWQRGDPEVWQPHGDDATTNYWNTVSPSTCSQTETIPD